ncbi:MAG: hypothetical protein WCW13_06020 [archaeon]|jgi:hypothetical protein
MQSAVREMALSYFKGLNKTQKIKLMKRIVALLDEEEKLALAKIIVGK